MRNITLIIGLIFSLFLLGCGNKNEKENEIAPSPKAEKAYKAELLDLSSIPIAPDKGYLPETISEEMVASNEASSVEQLPIDFYRDDFDSFDPEFWTVIEEKTGNLIPNQAIFKDGNLVIETAAIDRNPLFHSLPVKASPGDIIRVKRRALIHPGNTFANISFSLYGTEGTDLTVSKDIKTEPIASLQYLDFQYDEGRYPITTGVLLTVPGYKDSGEYTAWEPLFDTWVNEELEFHTDTGLIRITINGQTTELQGKPLSLPGFRVFMNAYGWNTGHRVTVDSLEITVEPRGLQPTGVISGAVLVKELVQPSVERTEIKTETGVLVSIPGLAAETAVNLEVKSIKFDDPQMLAGVEVSFGTIHEFDGSVRITIPIPEGVVPDGGKAFEYLHPVSFNPSTGEWDREPCIYGAEDVTIISNHLSTFALKRGPGIDQSDKNIEIATKKDAIEAGWSSMTGTLDWVSRGQSYTSLVSDNPFLEVLGDQLEKFGTGFAIISLVNNMAAGNDLAASIDAIKLVSGWALGKFATLGTQIAGIGTFFIDYSLNTLATNTLEAQYAAFEKAYDAYYKSEGKSVKTWYEEIKIILISSSSSDEASSRLNKSINEYVKRIWDDEAAFESYLAEVHGHGWGGDAGQTVQIKQKLEDNYKKHLGQTLKSAITRAYDWIENQAYQEQKRAEYKARDILKQDLRFWVDVYGNRKNDKLDAVLLHEETPLLVIPSSNSGAVDFLGFMTLSDYFNGPKPTHILLQGYLQIDDDTIIPVSMKQKVVWDDFTATITFDIERSKYVKEEPEEESETEEEAEEIIEDDDSVDEEEEAVEAEKYTVNFNDVKNNITPEDIADSSYSIFEIPIGSVARVETYPNSIEASFGSLSETAKAPMDPESGEYLSFISIVDNNGTTIATAQFRNTGYLEYATFIPETGMGKSVTADGMGHIVSEEYYLNGVLHGPSREYYDNGKFHTETFYKNGELHGPSRAYYENGQLESEHNNNNGTSEGLALRYYENGQLWSKSLSKGWGAWGPYETYFENGQLSSKGQYLPYELADGDRMGGSKIGYCQGYNQAGVLVEEEWYTKSGSSIESKIYNDGGWLEKHFLKRNGKLVGIDYDAKGNITGETEYE